MKTQNQMSMSATGISFNVVVDVPALMSAKIVAMRQGYGALLAGQKKIMDTLLSDVSAIYADALTPADFKDFCYKAEIKEGTISAKVTKKDLERVAGEDSLEGQIGLFLKRVYDAARNRAKLAEKSNVADDNGTGENEENGEPELTDAEKLKAKKLAMIESLAKLYNAGDVNDTYCLELLETLKANS